MRWTTAGMIFLLSGCGLAMQVAAAEAAPVTREIDIDHVERLVFLSPGRLHLVRGASEFVRLQGARAAVEDVLVRQQGRELLVQGASADVDVFLSAPGLDEISMDRFSMQASDAVRQCELTVTDEGKMNVESIIAQNVNIYLDGQSRLSVDSLIAGKVRTGLDAYGRLNVASMTYLSE